MLFPTTHVCLFCATPLRVPPFAGIWKRLCFACKNQLQWIDSTICRVCGRGMKQAKTNICSDCRAIPPTEWVYNRSVFKYNAFVKQLIWRYKYKGQEKLAEPLGWLMAEVLERHWSNKKFVLSYVPLHTKRLSERGFNQAKLLANVVGKHLRLPVIDLLQRKRITGQQSVKGRNERLTTLVGAFSLKPKVDVKELSGYEVLLIDDIYTTGATLRECSKPFKEQGIKNVYSITIAR